MGDWIMLEEGCAYPLSVAGSADIMVGYPSFALTLQVDQVLQIHSYFW